jgi:hypothetical protein
MRKLSVALVVALACLTCLTAAAGAHPTQAKRPTQGATVKSSDPLFTGAAEGEEYPPCGPYVSEGTTTICRFEQLRLYGMGSCSITKDSGSCPGSVSGPFPWGARGDGGAPLVWLTWKQVGPEKQVSVTSYEDRERPAVARLDGSIVNGAPDRFDVQDAFAQNDRPAGRGDHFYTPDFRGQAPGEVGGPLKFTFKDFNGALSSECLISGYLFLRR